MGKNYNGTQISQSVTVSEVAGATVEDCRNKIFVYDENGKAILATGGTKPFIGVALIEAGINDMFGEVSGKVEAGDDIDIQIKDIGSVIAGETISKGDEYVFCNIDPATGNYLFQIPHYIIITDENGEELFRLKSEAIYPRLFNSTLTCWEGFALNIKPYLKKP